MSLARIHSTDKSRKEWTCGKCHDRIPTGSKVLHFTVGFRGFQQHRCGKPECFPTNAERESSAVATVYSALESADLESASDLEELQQAVQEVIDACAEVADEYENNEMYEINTDLQERAETIRSAGDELESWDSGLSEEPTQDDYRTQCESCGGSGEDTDGSGCFGCEGGEVPDEEAFEEAHDEWLDEARSAARDALDAMDLP